MKKLALYEYTDTEGKLTVSTEPQPLTAAQLFYLLTADDGYYLYNKKLNRYRHSVIAPSYFLNDWVELKREKERDN